MWLYLTFLLIIGVTVADHNNAWETGKEYHYLIESRTLTALNELSQQFSGIVISGGLTVHVKSPDTLQAVISKPQYAPVHKVLPEGWNNEITDLEFDELSMTEKSFEIKLKNGAIRDMLIDQDVPTWEVNLIKSIVNQLQIDLQGENVIASSNNRLPDDNQPFGVFKAMEDSIGGKCEVLYSITAFRPTPENSDSIPNLRKDGFRFSVKKTRNYTRCEQRMAYHSGIIGKMNWKPGSSDGLVSRSSVSSIIISGHVKRFTIQSSLTTSEILIKAKFHDTYSGAVYSSVKLTLDKISEISNPMPASNNIVSTKNLVYTYNNPFSNQRKPRRSNTGRSSLADRYSESSSEESSSHDESSSSSSSSDTNSEERDYLQPKPKLNEAPESPLLPYFVGYKGKSIQKSEGNYALIAARLIGQITGEIEHYPDNILSQPYTETLEPYVILVRLIRTMNVNQITEVENKLPELFRQDNHNNLSNEDDQKLYDQTAWDVFTNAVTNAGTGPALISIKNWIKNGKLEGKQAAYIISKIPKAALMPTSEYVKAFFELITDEQVTKNRLMNASAPLAFAELVRYTQSNKSSNYYPVYSFGRMSSRHDNAPFETYIPYMATQLREAIKDGDSRRIQTYIVALGNFGHVKVLSVFEPYLEGTLPVSKFQRLMMVVSLNRLSENFPRVARSVAYKIYLNRMEAYELRCAAVYVIMKTNPPLVMLQRMARFTNQDQDRHVNSAVKTNMEALANLQQPELQDLANKARVAKDLLNPQINIEDTQGHICEKTIASINFAQTFILQTIGSNDIDMDKSTFLEVQQSYGGFNFPSSKISYEISSIRALLDMWYQMPWMAENKGEKKLLIEETIEKLGIKAEDPEQFEGNVFTDTVFVSDFFPFDNNTFDEIVSKATMYIEALQKTPIQVCKPTNMNYLYHYDMTLAFPTESGLPFIYTLTAPKLVRVSSGGSRKVIMSTNGRFMEVTVAGHLMITEKFQSRIGFVTPFEHRHYIAGIDVNSQFFIPAGLSFALEGKRKIMLKIKPKMHPHEYRYGTDNMAIHHSVVPYTSRDDILDFKSVVSKVHNNTLLVHTTEPSEIEFSLGDVKFSARSDYIDSRASKKMGIEALDEVSKVFANLLGAHYRSLDVIMHLTPAQVNITYEFVKLNDSSSEATNPAIIDKRPESESRKEQFLTEIGKKINSASVYIVDISASAERNNYVFTLASGYNRVSDMSQSHFYLNVQSSDDGKVLLEVCTVAYTKYVAQLIPRAIPMFFEDALEHIPNYEFEAEMRFGSCTNGETIKLKGNWTRTDDVKEMARKSETVRKCRQDIRQGNIWLPTCQAANKLINHKDLLTMSMETDSDHIYALANRMILLLKMSVSKQNLEGLTSGTADKNTINMEIKMPPDSNDAKISFRMSQMDVAFSLKDILGNDSDISLKKSLEGDFDESACILDKTHVITLDGEAYPLKLGNCWHVMMTTYPKRNPNNPEETLSIPNNMRVMVMVREMDDGNKQIRIILGDQEIHLQRSGDHYEATIDGQVANLTHQESHLGMDFEIFQQGQTVMVSSSQYEITLQYYLGNILLLQPSYTYINSVRGLCGNYDMQSNNDFIVPKNCILTKPEEFAATYALTQDNCQGPALQNKQKAEQSTCTPRSYRPSDVISDREAGRLSNKNRGSLR